MKTIDSADNPLFRKWNRLKSPRQSKKEKRILVEGLRHVADLISRPLEPEFLILSNDSRGREAMAKLQADARQPLSGVSDDRIIWLAPRLFERLSAMKMPQGVMAVLTPPVLTLDAFIRSIIQKSEGSARILILEDVQDPGNVGTLIRTADALGFDGVLLTDSTATVYNPKTAAASMGSIFHIPVVELEEGTGSAAGKLKDLRFVIAAASLEGESLALSRPPAPRLAVLLGNEGNGLSEEALACADLTVTIPMRGGAESLNVASAGAIFMWEIVRGTPLN